jgi:hypothetical protein
VSKWPRDGGGDPERCAEQDTGVGARTRLDVRFVEEDPKKRVQFSEWRPRGTVGEMDRGGRTCRGRYAKVVEAES